MGLVLLAPDVVQVVRDDVLEADFRAQAQQLVARAERELEYEPERLPYYLFFLDSTQARFWFRSAGARRTIAS